MARQPVQRAEDLVAVLIESTARLGYAGAQLGVPVETVVRDCLDKAKQQGLDTAIVAAIRRVGHN